MLLNQQTPVMILIGRPLYTEELVIHVIGSVSGKKPGLCCAVLCCVTDAAWPSDCLELCVCVLTTG